MEMVFVLLQTHAIALPNSQETPAKHQEKSELASAYLQISLSMHCFLSWEKNPWFIILSIFSFFFNSVCSGHGNCTAQDVCVCDAGNALSLFLKNRLFIYSFSLFLFFQVSSVPNAISRKLFLHQLNVSMSHRMQQMFAQVTVCVLLKISVHASLASWVLIATKVSA